jgi:hypothetical protein
MLTDAIFFSWLRKPLAIQSFMVVSNFSTCDNQRNAESVIAAWMNCAATCGTIALP